ncbi:hypothetical protein MMC21_007007 [Puttea exsequens]|nr:hypothetical protein [Puttea exsequens]
MASSPKTAVKVVFGAMTIGNGVEQSRVSDLTEADKILDMFQSHGHNEVDTSRFYGSGTSEEYLSKLDWQDRGLVMATKFYPTVGKGLDDKNWSHSPEHIRENMALSLKALNSGKVHMWYLHAPDRTTPFKVTLREVNEQYKQGRFDVFAISNYMSWEVAQICEICKANNFVMPSVYQGIYNSLNRTVEAELLPCLRHHGIGFYAYNPLGGGFFTGTIERDSQVEKGSRFDPEKLQGKMYRARYFREEYFQALRIVKPAAEKAGLTMAEVALRWMTHHSQLGTKYNDAILIGASSTRHIEENLTDLEKGPLPDDVVEALDEAWKKVKGITGRYWH